MIVTDYSKTRRRQGIALPLFVNFVTGLFIRCFSLLVLLSHVVHIFIAQSSWFPTTNKLVSTSVGLRALVRERHEDNRDVKHDATVVVVDYIGVSGRDRKRSFPRSDRLALVARRAQPSPINTSPSRVKRCALPYVKGATVNLLRRGALKSSERERGSE